MLLTLATVVSIAAAGPAMEKRNPHKIEPSGGGAYSGGHDSDDSSAHKPSGAPSGNDYNPHFGSPPWGTGDKAPTGAAAFSGFAFAPSNAGPPAVSHTPNHAGPPVFPLGPSGSVPPAFSFVPSGSVPPAFSFVPSAGVPPGFSFTPTGSGLPAFNFGASPSP
ncbi:hypothetical protein PYCC9005_001106 [Savitreella phatthalungensis]